MNRASTILKELLYQIEEEGVSITFGEFIARLDEKGYGLLVVASSLVVIIPTPPGLNSLAGILVLIWAVQRLLGRTPPWIPRFVRTKEVPERFLHFMEEKGVPFLEKLEHRLPQGGPASRANPFETKAASVLVALMALLTILPTPGLTSVAAAVITLVGLGIIYANRYVIWTSLAAGLLAFLLIGNVLWMGTDFLIDLF